MAEIRHDCPHSAAALTIDGPVLRRGSSARGTRCGLPGMCVLVLICLLSACYQVQRHPEQWPALNSDPGQRCAISGRYRSVTYSSEGKTEAAWDYLVNPPEMYIEGVRPGSAGLTSTGTELRVEQGVDKQGDYMDVSAHDGKEQMASKRLRAGTDYRCHEEGILITPGWSYININVGPAMARYRYLIQQDQDGGLVVRWLNEEAGLVFFVLPILGKRGQWLRWAPLDAAAVSAPGNGS